MPRSLPTHRHSPRPSPTCRSRWPLKAEEGKLFGTVTATDLAEALAAKGIELDRKLIAVEGIKTVGEYEATAKLHKEVKAVIKFSVTAAE